MRTFASAAGAAAALAVLLAAPVPRAAAANAPPQDAHVLFGVGAQSCRGLLGVAAESNSHEIALSGAMFSWAQGWFSARNLIGHESKPLTVGGSLSVEALKAQLVEECRAHPDEALYLAVDDLYLRLRRQGK
jgi:hypothetical protein